MAAKFTLTLNFSEDEEESVKYINQALSGMMLSSLDFGESNGYLTKTFAPDGKMTSCGYHFENISLSCAVNDEEEQHIHQLDVFASENDDAQEVFADWKSEHPELQFNGASQISFNGDRYHAYIIKNYKK